MIIRRHAVSMRTQDFHVNASQTLTAANLNHAERKKWLRKLKQRGVANPYPAKAHPNLWVPFRDGVFLCQAVGLEEDLMPLLSYPSLPFPPRNENYLLVRQTRRRPLEKDGYAGLWYGDCVVVYHSSKRLINATHLLRLCNMGRRHLTKFFAHNPALTKETRRGDVQTQGTYISFEDARVLCDYFNLNPAP